MCKAAAIDKQVMAVEFIIILKSQLSKSRFYNLNSFESTGKLYSWFSRSIDVKIDEL